MKTLKMTAFAFAALFFAIAPSLRQAHAQDIEADTVSKVVVTNWITPDPSARPGAVRVLIVNQGADPQLNFYVKLKVQEYADGPIGTVKTYQKLVAKLKPNTPTWVSISGFKWPNGNQYQGTVKIGTYQRYIGRF